MKKLYCAVMTEDADRLIKSLQKLSSVEMRKSDELGLLPEDTLKEREALASELSAVRQAIDFLAKYDKRKYSMFSPPPEGNTEEFDNGLDLTVSAAVRAAVEAQASLSAAKAQAAELTAEIHATEPWKEWKFSLPEERTKNTVTVCGSFPPGTLISPVKEKLNDCGAYLQLQNPDEDEGARLVSVTALLLREEEMKKILSAAGFVKCTVSLDVKETSAEKRLFKLKSELSQKKAETERCVGTAEKLSEKLPEIKVYHDVLLTRQRAAEAKGQGARTDKTVIFSGWIPASAVKRAEKALVACDAAYCFEDPAEGEDVPVALINNSFAKNFEGVLSMYSLPAYGTFDPTMVMSLFYAVIFGLMFADVGYGLILLAGCLLGLKLLHPKEGLRRMLTMFAICSVSCIAGGVLFGGYFGDLPSALMKGFGGVETTKSPALLFDMIEEPMSFLVVALIVGAVHLICGMVIKFIILCRAGHPLDAVFDVGSWLILFAGIGVFFISQTPGLILCCAGALMLILTQGRHEKNIFMKIGKGVLSLYDIVSYASDLLSYSRILALGLASAVIASVVNLLGTMGGPTVTGIIMFVFIFVIGHTINFLVNILGTYVHTSRLQYIEFFGKFFETGGKEFSPLKYDSKYVNLK